MSAEAQKEFEALKKSRRVKKAALTRMKNFLDKLIEAEVDKSQVEIRLQALDDIFSKFENIQARIEELNLEVEETSSSQREEFEEEYFSIKAKMKSICLEEKSKVSSSNLVNSKIKLPAIKLPDFDGKYEHWVPFNDAFNTLIHNDSKLSDLQKFYYLKSALKGPAFELIESLETSEANYNIARELLKERYSNERVIVQSHVKALFNLPKIEISLSKNVRELQNSVHKHLQALKTLKLPVNEWDVLIIHLVTSKFDKLSLQKWEESLIDSKLPSFADLDKFLINRCNMLEAIEGKVSDFKSNIKSNAENKQVAVNKRSFSSNKNCFIVQEEVCPVCNEKHKIWFCQKFKNMTIDNRLQIIKELHLCFNCLNAKDHTSKFCSRNGCYKCKLKHNVLLHREINEKKRVYETNTRAIDGIKSNSSDPEVSAEVQCLQSNNLAEVEPLSSQLVTTEANACHQSLLSTPSKQSQIILATAIIKIKDSDGNLLDCRCILDSGSQLNFITLGFANKLKLKKTKIDLPIGGINSSRTKACQTIKAEIYSRVSDYKNILNFCVLPNIASLLPSFNVNISKWNIPAFVKTELADPNFFISNSVDALLGAEIFFDLLKPEQVVLDCDDNSLPTLRNSSLGWLVSGRVNSNSCDNNCLLVTSLIPDVNYNEINENYKNKDKLTEDKQCEEFFKNNYERNIEGRFIVKLPFRRNSFLGSTNKEEAIRRFYLLEKRFLKQESIRIEYVKFMKEYLMSKHMEKVKAEEMDTMPQYYLPHHPVVKESTTTAVRVVFDASSKPAMGNSLNSLLLAGPTIQEELFTIVIRFRLYKYVITGDAEKMYRQILVAPEVANLQRIVWRESPEEELTHYKLLTVTYGTVPAAFIATRCMLQLANDYQHIFPRAAEVIKRDFYMDDLLTGDDNEEELLKTRDEVINILKTGGFKLRKWCANSKEIMNKIMDDEQSPHYVLDIGDDGSIKALGLIWRPMSDNFEFRLSGNCDLKSQILTRRIILSELLKIFDPLGFLAPVIIKGKIFIQQLCLKRLEWDDPLNEDLRLRWIKFYESLNELTKIQVPRRVKLSNTISIHAFCDASPEAYGCTIYIRSVDEDNQVHVRLLCAKARLAPIKAVSLPRLELCGALTLAKLLQKVCCSLGIKIENCYCWTDSTIVLAWLAGIPMQWKTFVANRVTKIQSIVSRNQWRHIRSEYNPADLLTRGMSSVDLRVSSFWFNGPSWLKEKESEWPCQDISNMKDLNEDIPEVKKIKLVLFSEVDSEDLRKLLSKFSSWTKLIRVTAYVYKFIDILKNGRSEWKKNNYIILPVYLINKAKKFWYKFAQDSCYKREILDLKRKKKVSKRSKILSLSPYLDSEELLRVGGRLKNSNLLEDTKHPIILPYDHTVTKLIFKYYHIINLHAGPQNLLAAIKQQFWPINGKRMAKILVRRCNVCFRHKPKITFPFMGQLPHDRVNPSRPFSCTGVDFCGPILIKSGIRKNTLSKAYIAVFVCFAVRAIHIEVVSNLTTSSFLAALRRFFSRRGKSKHIYSDNATNFVGARNELKKLFRDTEASVPGLMAEEEIEWHFIPPKSPHFGGLHEAAVRSTKYHLKRVIGNTSLNFEELTTLLCQVEASLNSRPLTPFSTDPNDLSFLSPAHFLIGGPLILPPDTSGIDPPLNKLKRWELIQTMNKHFWKRWSTEYILQLQQKAKWREKHDNVKVGDIVLIKEDNLPPQSWRLGRVIKVHPGLDGVVRVATMKTSNGVIKRAVTCLAPLPSPESC